MDLKCGLRGNYPGESGSRRNEVRYFGFSSRNAFRLRPTPTTDAFGPYWRFGHCGAPQFGMRRNLDASAFNTANSSFHDLFLACRAPRVARTAEADAD